MPSRVKKRQELAWWGGVVIWLCAVLFWHPAPTVSYDEAPSATTTARGFSIFFDLVATEAAGAIRVLEPPDELPEDVGVLALLSPSEPVSKKHKEQMIDWAVKRSGTLIIGHPILGEDKLPIDSFKGPFEERACPRVTLAQEVQAELDYTPVHRSDETRAVPTFTHPISSVFDTQACDASAMLINETNEVIVTSRTAGEAKIIEISDVSLLKNASTGWKTTHLFAAALIDEAGRSTRWAFDESHEGIHPKPRFVSMLGATKYRPIFLQIALLVLFGYWWKTYRIGRTLPKEEGRSPRDVAGAAQNTGNFYLRAGKSRWALARSYEHLKLVLKDKGAGADPDTKAQAEDALKTAESELRTNIDDMDRHFQLMRRIAYFQRKLTHRSKGKRR